MLPVQFLGSGIFRITISEVIIASKIIKKPLIIHSARWVPTKHESELSI